MSKKYFWKDLGMLAAIVVLIYIVATVDVWAAIDYELDHQTAIGKQQTEMMNARNK